MKNVKNNPGQAMVELTIGLVAIMVLLGAMIQIGSLINARTQTMARARAEAGADAVSAIAPARPTRNEYIYNWHPGGDGRPYTRDDFSITATSAVDALELTVQSSGMAGVPPPPDNPFGSLASAPDIVGDFALIYSRESASVDVLPVIRRLVYNNESIEVESDVWMVWGAGIY